MKLEELRFPEELQRKLAYFNLEEKLPRGVPLYSVQQRIVNSRDKLEKDLIFWQSKKLRLLRMLASLTPPIPVLLRCILQNDGVDGLYAYVHQYFHNFGNPKLPNLLSPVEVLKSAIEIETENFTLQKSIDTLNARVKQFLGYTNFWKALKLIRVYFNFTEKPFLKTLLDSDVLMHTRHLPSRHRLETLKLRLLNLLIQIDEYIANTFFSEEWHEHIRYDGETKTHQLAEKIDVECDKVKALQQVFDFFSPCTIKMPARDPSDPEFIFEKMEHIKRIHFEDALLAITGKYNEWKYVFGFITVQCAFANMAAFGEFALQGITSFVDEASNILSSEASIDFWIVHFALCLMEYTLMEIMAKTTDKFRKYKFGVFQVHAKPNRFKIEEGSLLGMFVISIILVQAFLYPDLDSVILVCNNRRFTYLYKTLYYKQRIQPALANKPIGKKGISSLYHAMLDVFSPNPCKSKIKHALLCISRIILPELSGVKSIKICSSCVPTKGVMPKATPLCPHCNGTLFVEGLDRVEGFPDSSVYGAFKNGVFNSIRTSRMNLAKYCSRTDESVLRNRFTPTNDDGFVEQSIFDTMNLDNYPIVIPTTKKRKHGAA